MPGLKLRRKQKEMETKRGLMRVSDGASKVAANLVPLVSEGGREAAHRASHLYHSYSPKVTDSVRHGVHGASSRIDRYASNLSPEAHRVRDLVVDDYAPRAQGTYSAANSAAAAAITAALSAGRDEWDKGKNNIYKAATSSPKKKDGVAGKVLLVVGLIGVAGGAGYLAWKKSKPVEDPWAPPADFARAHYPAAGSTEKDTEEVSDSVGGAEAGDVASSLNADSSAVPERSETSGASTTTVHSAGPAGAPTGASETASSESATVPGRNASDGPVGDQGRVVDAEEAIKDDSEIEKGIGEEGRNLGRS